MSDIQGIPAASIDWSKLVDAINSADPAAGVTKASFDASRGSVTITTAGDNARTVTISAPELQSPGMVDESALDSFVAKLAAEPAFNFTDDQLAQITDAIDKAFAAAAAARSAAAGATAPGSLFDIYQLAALMLEASQKQRDAARDIRLADNQAIQNSILHQAGKQRDAALTGMIAGFVVCAVQVVAQGAAVFKSAQAYSKQSNVATEVGVKEAQIGLHDAKAALKLEQKTMDTKLSRLKEIEAMPEGTAKTDALTEFKNTNQLEGDTVEAVRGNLLNSDSMTAAKTRVANAEQALSVAESRMTAHSDFLEGNYMQTKWRSLSDIFAAAGNAAQGFVRSLSDMMQAEATEQAAVQKKSEEHLDQIKDLFNQCQEVINKIVQMMAAVIQAETQSMRDAIHA